MVELLPPPQVLASRHTGIRRSSSRRNRRRRDRKKRDEAAAREFAEQAEFFKNTELLSAKDRERLRNKQQLAFMYQKPPGSTSDARATEAGSRRSRRAHRRGEAPG